MVNLRGLILKEWFRFFFGAFIILILLISVAELISGFMRSNVTPLEVILNHLIEITEKFKLIVPVSCLSASLFSINKLKNRNELTAIFAAGYSRKKFMIDIAIGAMIVSVSQFTISSFIEPYTKSKKDFLIEDGDEKFKNLKSQGLMAATIGSGRMWFKNEKYFFSFSTFNKEKNQLNDVSIYSFNEDSQLIHTLKAKEIFFKDSKWIGKKVEEYTELSQKKFPLKTIEEEKEIILSEHPDDFKEIEADITTLNIFQLYKYISKLQLGGINVNEYLVMFLEKISISIVCLIFSLVAAIGAFSPNRRGSSFGKSILGVFVFVVLYWLINSYFIELGKSSKIDPYLSCFGVPFVFGLFLIFQFIRNRKLI